MSALSDFIIWSGEGLPDYDGIRKFPDADRFQLKNITPLEAAGLLEALRGAGDRLSMISEFPCLTPEQAETWIIGVPDDFVSRLAQLESDGIAAVAQRFSQITAEELGWPTQDCAKLVKGLSKLARRAQTHKQRMFLWMGL